MKKVVIHHEDFTFESYIKPLDGLKEVLLCKDNGDIRKGLWRRGYSGDVIRYYGLTAKKVNGKYILVTEEYGTCKSDDYLMAVLIENSDRENCNEKYDYDKDVLFFINEKERRALKIMFWNCFHIFWKLDYKEYFDN